MTHADDLLKTYPGELPLASDLLADVLDTLADCAQACTACADACLAEDEVAELRRCIRLNLDCADLCEAILRVLSRQTAYDPAIARAAVRACAQACRTCAEECTRHGDAGMAHCAVCAEVCRRCAQACEALLAQL